MIDHYAVLEVSKEASLDEIQRAYRTLAMRYHPDRNPAPDAAARMAVVNEAYEVLRDRGRRREYDASRSQLIPNTELDAAIIHAARDVILRAGLAIVEETTDSVLLVRGKQRVRVLFIDRLNNDSLRRLLKRYSPGGPTLVLALQIEGSIHAGPAIMVVGLMRGERYGALLADDENSLFKPLLVGFL
jgi:curved DNA-binding protein CbpA